MITVHPEDRARAEALAGAVQVHPLTAQLLLNRGVCDATAARRFLRPDADAFEAPAALPAMDRALARLRRAVRVREPILIFGDSDVDGLTSSAILYEVLRSLGGRVRVKLSNRIEDGYGMPASIVAHAVRSSVTLVVMLDCGTNQADRVKALSRRGIDTIVIDHHLPMEGAASPFALVNPHAAGGAARGRELCSAGLAFKVAQGLLGEAAPERLPAYLDLAALGTLADYAPLLGDSRVLVALGLKRIVNSLRPGLQRLCQDTQTQQPVRDQVLRRLVPRLNAFGRLGDPTSGWHLLLEADHDRIEEWLSEAEQAHATTKQLQRRLIGEAQEQISRMHFRDHVVLVVSRSDWHQGLMGPLASQLAERYGRPTIAIAMNGARGKGSARSIPLFNLLDVLQSCRGVLEQLGGHAQACGLTVSVKNLEPFREMVNRHAHRFLSREGLIRRTSVDLELTLKHLQPSDGCSPRWIEESERFAPYGPGNPRPTVLLRGLRIEMRSARTGWLTDGTRRVASKGKFPEVVAGARYDVAVSPGVVDGELVLTLRDAKASREDGGTD